MTHTYYTKPPAASWSDYHRARKYHRKKRRYVRGRGDATDLYWRYHGKVFPLNLKRTNERGDKWFVPIWDYVTFGDNA